MLHISVNPSFGSNMQKSMCLVVDQRLGGGLKILMRNDAAILV